jgi:hypothetical protein
MLTDRRAQEAVGSPERLGHEAGQLIAYRVGVPARGIQ